MAAIKKILQVFKKLPKIGRLDETLQAQLIDPLPQIDINIFRQQQVEILPRAFEHAQTISVKSAGKYCRLAPHALLNAGLQLIGSIVSERDGQNLFRLGV